MKTFQTHQTLAKIFCLIHDDWSEVAAEVMPTRYKDKKITMRVMPHWNNLAILMVE